MKNTISVVLARIALLMLILSLAGLCPINPSAATSALADKSRTSVSGSDPEKDDAPSAVSDEESGEKESEQAQPKKGIGEEELSIASSVTQAIQGQDGVTVQTMCTNCNEANIELGGLGDEHVNVNIDGFRLFGGLPRIYALAILPSPAISNIDVSSGPGYAEHYYEAIGGTIDLTTHKPVSRPSIQAVLETGSYGWGKTSLFGDWKLGILSGRIAGTKSQSNAIDANDDGFVETGKVNQWTGSINLQMQFRRLGNFSFGATRIRDEQIDGHGRLEKEQFTGIPIGYLKEDTRVDWLDYRFGYDILLPKGHVIQLRALKYNREQRIKAPTNWSFEPKEERYFIEEENTYGDIKWLGPIGSRWILSAGFNNEDDVNAVSGVSMPVYLPVLEESVKGWGAFSQASVDILPELVLIFGTRYDSFDIFGEEWSPRSSVIWKPIRSFTITTSFGYGFRPPRPVFSEICCGQSPEKNENVKPERSKSMSIDFTYQPVPAWKFTTYLHRSNFDDYIIKMVAGSVDLHQKLMQGNIEDATIQGFDTSLSWKWSKGLSVSGSFSWVDAHNNNETITLLPNVWAPFEFIWPVTLPLTDIPYIAEKGGQVSLRYAPPNGIYSLSIMAQYTGSMLIQHYFDVPFSVFPPVVPPGGLYEDYVSTPDFWIVNLAGSIRIKKHIEWRFGVDNITDYVQKDLGDFTRDYNWGPIRGRYLYTAISYNY